MRWLLVGFAGFCFAFGWLGVFVPGLPTTVFWIAAVVCAGKACPTLKRWMYERGRAGDLVRNVVEERSLPVVAKLHATIGLWITLVLSAAGLALLGVHPAFIGVGMMTVGLGVTLLICLGLRNIPTTQSKLASETSSM